MGDYTLKATLQANDGDVTVCRQWIHMQSEHLLSPMEQALQDAAEGKAPQQEAEMRQVFAEPDQK